MFNEAHNKETYKVRIDEETFELNNSAPTGRELLSLVKKSPENFLLTLVVPNKPDELVETDEPIDLSAPGTEQFNLVTKERFFSILIDEQPFRISNPTPTGTELLAMVGKTPAKFLLTFQIVGQADAIIDPDEKVNITLPGREQLWTVARKPMSIIIDDVNYKAPKEEMSGEELRNLPTPPVAANRDLWLDVPGKDDLRVKPEHRLVLKDGMVFYTAPSKINPGGSSRDAS